MEKGHRRKELKWMQALLPVFMFVLLAGPCVAAPARTIDSLRQQLKKHANEDTTRALLLARLAGFYHNGTADTLLVLARESYKISEHLGYKRGIAYAELQLGSADLINTKYEHALVTFRDALKRFQEIGDIDGEIRAYNSIGTAYFTDVKFGEALDTIDVCLKLAQENGDLQMQGFCYATIGDIYKDLGNYPVAIQNYLAGMKFFEQIADESDISNGYTNLATVYEMMGEYQKAIDYINKSMAIAANTNDSHGVLYNEVNIGVIKGEQQDYAGALSVFQKALALADSLKDEYWEATCNVDIGEALYYLGRYDESLQVYKETAEHARVIREFGSVAAAENGIGDILVKQGRVQEAITHLVTAYQLVERVHDKEHMFEMAIDICNALEKAGDFKSALKYHKLYFDLRDSLFNETGKKKIQQLQFDYELGKKEDQIKLLQKDHEIEKTRIEKQRILVLALIGGLSLLVVIVVQLNKNNKKEKKARQNIQKQQEELMAQAKKLEDLNRFKDKTFSVLSHDLRGPLSGLASTMKMLDEGTVSEHEFVELIPDITKQIDSLNMLLENLLNWSRSYMTGQTVAKMLAVTVKTAVGMALAQTANLAAGKHVALCDETDSRAAALCDPDQLNIVLRNLVVNAIKFTPSGGNVTLSSGTATGVVQIIVHDNGVGMSPEKLAKLFTAVPGQNTYGTAGETGTGLGLLLCRDFIRANKGTLTAESEEGKGSTFTITLPVA